MEKYHHIKDTWLTDGIVRAAMTVTIAYVTMYGIVTIIGVLYGYPLEQAAFEGISAASNTGLSCGVLTPAMPSLMKVSYILAMWLGRLEFMSVFALIGYGVAVVKGK